MPSRKKKRKHEIIASQEDEEQAQYCDYRTKIAEVFRPKKKLCRCCKPAYLLKTQIQEEWEGKMDDTLSLRVYKHLFPKNAKKIEFPKFCHFYEDLAEKDLENRAKTICKLSNVFKEEPNVDQDTTMDCLLKVVSSIIGSFFENMSTMGLKEMVDWTGLGAINCSVDNYQLAISLCANLPITTEEDGTISRVKAEDIAIWISDCPLFNDITIELFKSLFGITPDDEFNSFLPHPIYESQQNNTLLALPNILILNHFTRRRQTRKWTSIFTSMKTSTETWDRFLSTVRGMGPTLTILQDKQGGIFGMFASQRWYEDEDFYGNDECFLFTLKPEVNLYSASGNDTNFQFFNGQGVGMGGDKDGFGLFIDHSLRKGFTAEKCKTFSQYSPLSSETEFEIKTIEIWTVSTASSRQSASFFLKDDEIETIMIGAGLIQEKETSKALECDEVVLESTTLEDDESTEKLSASLREPVQPGRNSLEEANDSPEGEAAGDAPACSCTAHRSSKEDSLETVDNPHCACEEAETSASSSSPKSLPTGTSQLREKSIQSEGPLSHGAFINSPSCVIEVHKTSSSPSTHSRRHSTTCTITEPHPIELPTTPAHLPPRDQLCSCSPVNTAFQQFYENSNATVNLDRTRGSDSSRKNSKMKMQIIEPNTSTGSKVELCSRN